MYDMLCPIDSLRMQARSRSTTHALNRGLADSRRQERSKAADVGRFCTHKHARMQTLYATKTGHHHSFCVVVGETAIYLCLSFAPAILYSILLCLRVHQVCCQQFNVVKVKKVVRPVRRRRTYGSRRRRQRRRGYWRR